MRGHLLFSVLVVCMGTFGFHLAASAKGPSCSHLFNKKAKVEPPSRVIRLDFEDLLESQNFVINTLQESRHIQNNRTFNEAMMDVTHVLNRLLDDYVSTMQFTHMEQSPQSRHILYEFLGRNEVFFLNLLGGNREGLIQLLEFRVRSLEEEQVQNPNRMGTIGFIQNADNQSNTKSLRSIGFTQSKPIKARPLSSIGFIQPSATDSKPRGLKRPQIGFVHPEKPKKRGQRARSSSPDTSNNEKIGLLHPDSSDVSYRNAIVINPKLGQFEVEQPGSIGFVGN